MAFPCFVIVRKGAVEWIEPWREIYRNIVAATGSVRLVNAAVILRPVFVPRTRAIGYWVVAARLLADPEDRSHDVVFPRVTLPWMLASKLPRRKRNRTDINQTIVS